MKKELTREYLEDITVEIAVENLHVTEAACSDCKWQKELLDAGNGSQVFPHFFMESPVLYEKTKHYLLIASLNPLEVLERCIPLATNLDWCIFELKSLWADASWLTSLYDTCIE